MLHFFETKPEITIFLKDGLDQKNINEINQNLSQYPNVREVKYISKDKALNIYKEQNKDNPMLTEMVTASILPASFEVSVSDPKVLDQIDKEFSTKTNIVDEIIYQKDIIKSILNFTNITRKTGLSIVSVTTLTSFLITFVIIGMKITNRKEEIRISRLLGASKFYVKKPFLIEGVIYGLIGSFLGSFLSFTLAFYFQKRINFFFQPITFINNDINFYLIVFFSQVLIGTAIGYFASFIGVKRYIKY
ncbi:MAG: permease-like cell division protein FtsX [Candidatus Shapirobacteria bacterium]|nr:permease-like cell division protein FtsX [Candidatus Shapirobacteria bacterium]